MDNDEVSNKAWYHVWFATKERKWLFLGDIERAIKEEIARIAKDRDIELEECETVIDHVHLLLRANPTDLPRTMQYLKGGSSYHIFRRFPELRLDGNTDSLWQARYAAKRIPVESVPAIKQYIRTQKKRLEKYDR